MCGLQRRATTPGEMQKQSQLFRRCEVQRVLHRAMLISGMDFPMKCQIHGNCGCGIGGRGGVRWADAGGAERTGTRAAGSQPTMLDRINADAGGREKRVDR